MLWSNVYIVVGSLRGSVAWYNLDVMRVVVHAKSRQLCRVDAMTAEYLAQGFPYCKK